MPSSSPSPGPPSTSTTSRPDRAADYARFKHITAISFLIVSPVLLALPPRKLDIHSILLGTAFLMSANHLTTTQTGSSIPQHISSRFSGPPSVLRGLPTEKAEELHAAFTPDTPRADQFEIRLIGKGRRFHSLRTCRADQVLSGNSA